MITMATAYKYINQIPGSTNIIGNTIMLTQINMPYFLMLYNGTTDLTGTFSYDESVGTNDNFGPNFVPIVWVNIANIAIVNGLFPNGEFQYSFPTSNTANPLYITAAEACRVRFTYISGAATGKITVGYFGKSLG